MHISSSSSRKVTASALIASILLWAAVSAFAQSPRNVILFIGDGMGAEHVRAARLYQGSPLSFENFPTAAQVKTYSANSAVTDSAAGATAMATGNKVNNGVISVALPGNGAELETTLEFFKKQGKATGLITTAYLTHATPAGFGAHDTDRNNTTAIGADLMNQTQPDVLFGGGGNGLDSATAAAAGYQVATDTAGFVNLDTALPKLCGLFGTSYMPYEEDYLSNVYPYPHLREMVAKALDELGYSKNGFFLMVEAGRIDHAAGSSTLPEMVHETLELSRAVKVALDWAAGRADTMIIVTADHETGGLTVTKDNGAGTYPTVTWASSFAHTAANVPAYAYGVDAERVSGTLENTYLHAICTGEALSVPTTAVTLVQTGATWRYDASGTDRGTAWQQREYDDSTWLSGRAQLGYGDGDEATLLPASPVFPCYYFRHRFTVGDPAAWSSLSIEILRDDGAVVYLNGQEVARYNIDDNPVQFSSWAALASEFSWDAPKTIPNLLLAGDNVLAVEIHQAGSTSTDISFDLKLTGNTGLTVTPLAPVAGAVGVTAPATLRAAASDPAGNPVTVAFYGRPTPPESPDFSIVVLPDAQNYTAGVAGGSPAMFIDQTQWIVENTVSRNIVYAAQVGDVSGDGDSSPAQWEAAQAAFELLERAGLPYGLAVGNHDQYVPAGDDDPTTLYNQYFGSFRFQGRSYYGGHYGDKNNNHYDLFSASGMEFIVIYLEYATNSAPATAVLDWADGLLKNNPTRRGILISHELITLTGAWTAQGQGIYTALRDNPNLFLMLCGHYSGEAKRTDVYGGNTVHTVMANYQDDPAGGNGFLRVLRFSPASNQVFVQTYSPWLDQYQTDSASEFALSYAMTTGPAFALIQETTAVASGTPTSATWNGLAPGAAYEWFVVATDGPERTISETRRFSVLNNLPPCITIASPGDGARFPSPAIISIQASASDPDGSLASVEFFVNGASLGSVTSTPYELAIELNSGTYTLTVVATDDKGAKTTSEPVQVVVGAPPAAPTELLARADSRTQITLNWTDMSNNEVGFEIYQATAGSSYILIGTTSQNGAIVTGLQPGTLYVFKVRAFNVSGFAESDPVAITTQPNALPSAAADSYSVTEDSVLTAADLTGVLANDSDADGDSLVAALISGPTHGSVNLGADGSFTYTPNTNFNGLDSFTYEARDNYSGAAAAVTITVTEANDAPTVPPSVTATAGNGLVILSWLASGDPDGDLLEYQVYRSEIPGAYSEPLAKVSELGYVDNAVVNGNTYYYVIVAIDGAGAKSNPTGEVSAKPDLLPVDVYVSGNPLVSFGALGNAYQATFDSDGVTQNITESGTSTGARLQADYTLITTVNPADIASLTLFLKAQWSGMDGTADLLMALLWNYAAQRGEPITVDSEGKFSPAGPCNYVSQNGEILVRFMDGAAIRREKKDTLSIDQLLVRIMAAAPDTTPPSAPVGFSATPGDCQITLNWVASLEPDVVGYNVYRATTEGYGSLNTAPVAASTYVDSELENGRLYSYVVTAVDAAGNESDPSPGASATPFAQPPAAPSGLTAIAGDTLVTLDWADNAEAYVLGYRVYRWAESGGILVGEATTSQYTVANLENGTTYTYYVTALDSTRESSKSDNVSATPTAQLTMHVEMISMDPLTKSGKSYKASGTAYVITSTGVPLGAASVTAQWWVNSGSSSSLLQTQTVLTDGNGAAPFSSSPIKVTSGTSFTLHIVSATSNGYLFLPEEGISEGVSPQVP